MSIHEEHVLYLCQKVVEQICQELDVVDIISNILQLHSTGQTVLPDERSGRQKASDIILVNPFGLAIEDIALARHIYDYALSHALGTWLDR